MLRRPVESAQYTAVRYTEHLALEGIAPSIGSVGDAYDNGLMESVIGLFKTECIGSSIFHAGPYKTLADVEYATAGWVDWYNRRVQSVVGPPRSAAVRAQVPDGVALGSTAADRLALRVACARRVP